MFEISRKDMMATLGQEQCKFDCACYDYVLRGLGDKRGPLCCAAPLGKSDKGMQCAVRCEHDDTPPFLPLLRQRMGGPYQVEAGQHG